MIFKIFDKMSDNIVKVKNLKKEFVTKVKESGLKGSIKSIFKPNYEKVIAVKLVLILKKVRV